MLKTSYTQDNKELKMWVDPNDGSLNVSIDGKQVSVPDETGRELISIMLQKQRLFNEEQRQKLSFWSRFLNAFNFKQQHYEAVQICR